MALISMSSAVLTSNSSLGYVLTDKIVGQIVTFFKSLQVFRLCDARVSFCVKDLEEDLRSLAIEVDPEVADKIVLVLRPVLLRALDLPVSSGQSVIARGVLVPKRVLDGNWIEKAPCLQLSCASQFCPYVAPSSSSRSLRSSSGVALPEPEGRQASTQPAKVRKVLVRIGLASSLDWVQSL